MVRSDAGHPSLDSLHQAEARAYLAAFTPWTKMNREAFGRTAQNRIVELPNVGHYFFMKEPDETARTINAFLHGL